MSPYVAKRKYYVIFRLRTMLGIGNLFKKTFSEFSLESKNIIDKIQNKFIAIRVQGRALQILVSGLWPDFDASFTSKFPMTVGPTIKPLEFREANIIISNRSGQIFDIILHFENIFIF